MARAHSMVEFNELVGKAIKRLRFTNDDDFRAVSIDFDDRTALSFQLELDLRAKALSGGNITSAKRLKPAPVIRRRPRKH